MWELLNGVHLNHVASPLEWRSHAVIRETARLLFILDGNGPGWIRKAVLNSGRWFSDAAKDWIDRNPDAVAAARAAEPNHTVSWVVSRCVTAALSAPKQEGKL